MQHFPYGFTLRVMLGSGYFMTVTNNPDPSVT